MNFIVSLLAIAALLVVLSTLTTAFIEVVHGLVKQRVRDLEKLVGTLFDKVFLDNEKTKTDAERGKFIEAMTTNPVAKPRSSGPLFLPLIGDANAGKLDWLDLRQFLQQLANTGVGDKLAADEATLKDRLERIAAQFERFAEASTTLFSRRSGIYAGLAGVGLAAFMNFDGALVAERLFEDSALAQKVIVTYPAEELQKLVDNNPELACSTGTEEQQRACQQNAKGKAAQQELSAAQTELQGLGLPIGSAYFPFCQAAEGTTAQAADKRCGDKTLGNWLGWLASIAITGALIGLGAPFWFDVYKRIAGFATFGGLPETVTAAIGLKEKDGQAAPQTPVPKPNAPLSPDDLLKIFKLARTEPRPPAPPP